MKSDDKKVLVGLDALTRLASRTMRSLSKRELWAFRAGLHASHAEEALLTGEPLRARAHVKGLLKFAQKLRGK